MLLVIALLAASTQTDVTLVMSDKFLRMPADSGSILMIYRNASGITWNNAWAEVESDFPLDFKVTPKLIHRCQPADRCVFEVAARRAAGTPVRRFPVQVRLRADDRPDLHSARLLVDSTPQAGRRESGWMDAGTIQVGRTSKASRVLVLSLLCALPVAALIVLGFYLKRKARKEAE